jgi:UDP-N-acetylglucosamine acyltransferase
MIGGLSAVVQDVVPFGLAVGDRAYLSGLNLVGIKRRGFDTKHALEANKALDELFSNMSGTFKDKVHALDAKYPHNPILSEIIDFLKEHSSKSILKPKS